MQSDFLRIKCRNIDASRLSLVLAELRSIGLLFFDYENKISKRIEENGKNKCWNDS